MIYYIEDSSGAVVAQFDGVEVAVKDDHERHEVGTSDDLPGVDEWDEDYIDQS